LVQLLVVMAGLVPAIHVVRFAKTFEHFVGRPAWMLGTRPGVTSRELQRLPTLQPNFFPRIALPRAGEEVFRRLANVLNADKARDAPPLLAAGEAWG
jgi:hypothetical protein